MKPEGELTGKLGVFSDVHANLEALQTVLAALDDMGVDSIMCCGDVVGYGASPNECVELLRERNIPSVLGNHDAATLRDEEVAFFNDMARQAVMWTREEMTEDNIQWLRDQPMTRTWGDLLFVHASPADPPMWNYVLTYVEAREAMRRFDEKVCFIGHSHQPFFISHGFDGIDHVRQVKITVQSDLRYLVNVGSVGQPRDRNPQSAFVTLDFDTGTLEIHRVDYDIEKTQAKILARGGPRQLADRLAHGY